MTTKIEKAISLLEDAADELKSAGVRDVLEDLKAMLKKGASEAERPGLLAAIEVIETNYMI